MASPKSGRRRYDWRVTNDEFLSASAEQALLMIGEHAPEGAVIVQAATVCRLVDSQGGVYVVTDVTTTPEWSPPDALPSIAEIMEAEAAKLRDQPSGRWRVDS